MSELEIYSIEDPDRVDKIFGVENPKDVFCLYGGVYDDGEEIFTSEWNKYDPDFQTFLIEDFEKAQQAFDSIVDQMEDEWDGLKDRSHKFDGEIFYEIENCAFGVALFETPGGNGLILSSDFNPTVSQPVYLIDQNIRNRGVVGEAIHCRYWELPEDIKEVLNNMGMDVSEPELI